MEAFARQKLAIPRRAKGASTKRVCWPYSATKRSLPESIAPRWRALLRECDKQPWAEHKQDNRPSGKGR